MAMSLTRTLALAVFLELIKKINRVVYLMTCLLIRRQRFGVIKSCEASMVLFGVYYVARHELHSRRTNTNGVGA
jgi:hypothetical protein